jgi:hypothetical protein
MGREVVQDAMKDSVRAEFGDKFSLGVYQLIFAQNQKMTGITNELQ